MAALRAELVAATLRHATSAIPYYTRLLAAGPSPTSLDQLPIVDASTIAENYLDFCDQSRWPDGWLVTGGTTGVPNLLPRAASEKAFARARWAATSPTTTPRDNASIALHIIDTNHGSIDSDLHGAPLLLLPLIDAGHARHVSDLILHGIEWNGVRRHVRAICGTVTKLKALTNYMHARGLRPQPGAGRGLLTYAWHLSPTALAALRSFWHAPVQVTYGLTEANVELAMPCPSCGRSHFRGAIATEFVHPITRGPITAGDAELCVTTLYPFLQISPRLRFATRDVVRPGPLCPATGERSFEFIGRTRHVLLHEVGPHCAVIFAARGVVDALDALPWVARRDKYQQAIMQDGPGDLASSTSEPLIPFGFPIFALSIDQPGRHIRLHVEAAPGRTPGAPDEVRSLVARAQAAICPQFERLIDTGSVRLECAVLEPGGLARLGLNPESV